MASQSSPSISLPDEVKAVVWRVFDRGESPGGNWSTYELIEPVVKEHASLTDTSQAITEMRGWFEQHGTEQRLKSEMREPVAALVLMGIEAEPEGKGLWAVSSINGDLAARTILSRWSPKRTESFVEAALVALRRLCDRDHVLDARRCAGLGAQDATNARIPKSAVERKGRLETYRHLEDHGFELVEWGLYPAAGNLIDLLIELRPERFQSLIERLDHPVVRARAAQTMVGAAVPLDHRTTVEWISNDPCDALVALAVVHTLNTVNGLDSDLRFWDQIDPDQYKWTTELRPPDDDLDAAATDLLTGMVDRLALLDPVQCVRWVGEVLSDAPYGLHRSGDHSKPRRIEELERACVELLARLVRQSSSEDLLTELCAGLCLTPRRTWTRHLADVAWEIRHAEPARAARLGRQALDLHDQHIAEELEQDRLFMDWSDWHHRESYNSLGKALVLSEEQLDPLGWLDARCRKLPLGVWDAEENQGAFIAADRAVHHGFLVALHAIPLLPEVGREISPGLVRTLAEKLWDHCHFAGQYAQGHFAASITSEFAARLAVEFGEPSDVWLLERARHLGVGPIALLALIDRRDLKSSGKDSRDAQHGEAIPGELKHILSGRFGDGGQFDLETLGYWGRLWLMLGAPEESEETAKAIRTFPLRDHDRGWKIMILRLYAFVGSRGKLAPDTEEYVAFLYNQLWPGYSTNEEVDDRREVDELLKQWKSPIMPVLRRPL